MLNTHGGILFKTANKLEYHCIIIEKNEKMCSACREIIWHFPKIWAIRMKTRYRVFTKIANFPCMEY